METIITVRSACVPTKIVGISLLVSRLQDKGKFGIVLHKRWMCNARRSLNATTNSENHTYVHTDKYQNSRLASYLHTWKVHFPFTDDLAFKPSVFNRNFTVALSSNLVVWMMEHFRFSELNESEKKNAYNFTQQKKTYPINLLPPLARPLKTFPKSCHPWYWLLLQQYWNVTGDVCFEEQSWLSFSMLLLC